MAGIYVHIPFCSQFCTYCNFYSVKGKDFRSKYVSALKKEIESRKDFFKNTGVLPQTIYLGGGTPSLLSADELADIFGTICSTFRFTPVEATIEVNPNDVTLQFASGLRQAGFNRVSMGIQSFFDDHLVWMNRRHNGKEAVEAFNILRRSGFTNISLDLIFGYQGLSNDQWRENISRMIALAPEHISAYQMSIEEGSRLFTLLQKGEYDLTPDNICLEQYSLLQKMLQQAGYIQYEISNFARRSEAGEVMVSKHNSSYWTKEPYLGLGPAAHSYNGSHRFWNAGNVTAYCRHFLDGEQDTGQVCSGEELDAADIFNESVMLGLRRTEGVDVSTLDPHMLSKVSREIKRHCQLGNLVIEGSKIRIPSEKLFVSDGIIMDLFV